MCLPGERTLTELGTFHDLLYEIPSHLILITIIFYCHVDDPLGMLFVQACGDVY